MKRRDFLKSSIILASSSSILASCKTTKDNEGEVSGFIFSDAHIGWKGSDQPTIEQQSNAIQIIKKRFPSIDLVFDTGDIHHGYLNESERNYARSQWLTFMANQFDNSLFHYIPGNHELGKGLYDSEITSSKLGSQNLRPYYSFDYKGIHFISLPELADTILINRESLEWLNHDLLINKEKTTLIFSHNSVAKTTYNNGETGYRVLVNSEQVLDIINKHGNVIGWLHGHNHQYEVVKKGNRLYVSNGRLGGFMPPKSWGNFGSGHLGGIYFTINKKEFKVECFSATKNDFLSNLGYSELSNSIKVNTTYNPRKGVNYYFGHGTLTDNVTHEITNHYHSKEMLEVYTKLNNNNILNENSNFDFTTDLYFSNKRINRTIGYQILPKAVRRNSSEKGLEISKEGNSTFLINIPRSKITKDQFMTRPSYYRCESNDVFQLIIELSSYPKSILKGKIYCIYTIYNIKHEILFKSERIKLKQESSKYSSRKLIVPKMLNQTIEPIYFKISTEFLNFPKNLKLLSISLSKLVKRNTQQIQIDSTIKKIGDTTNFTLNNEVFKTTGKTNIRFNGKTPISCIIKIRNVLWQIRNAISTFDNKEIHLLDYRHNYQKNNEVIITPTYFSIFYLYKVINIMPLDIVYLKNKIIIRMQKISSSSKLYFRFRKKPLRIIGSKNYKIIENVLIIKPETKTLEILY